MLYLNRQNNTVQALGFIKGDTTMSTMKIANEAYKLILNCDAVAPVRPERLVSALADTAAFQIVLNSDNPYSVNVSGAEWYSAENFAVTRLPHERLRVAVESPFGSELFIEEFVTDDDGIKKADILLRQDARDSSQNVPSAVYAEIKVPADAKPGKYSVTVRLFSSFYNEDERLVDSVTLPLHVYNYTVPDARDWKLYLDLWQHNSNIARKYDVRLWSDEHFAVIEKVVKSLAQLGQKSVTVCASEIPWCGQGCYRRPYYGGNLFEYSIIKITKRKDGRFFFDYSIMQRYIDLCAKYGICGDIEVFGLVNLWRYDDFDDPKIDYVEPIRLRYYDESDGTYKYVNEKETVLDYIRSLEEYFKRTGQISRVRIAADEPADVDKYRKSIEAVKSVAPSFFFKTAINHAEFIEEFGDVINDFVPFIYTLCEENDRIKDLRKKYSDKRFLWYVCCGEGRPNTQLRQELTECRMIGPMNYYFGLDGFLRWSYTTWPDDPRADLRYSSWECGDTALVYPAHNGDVLLSLRYKNMRRGLCDHELLRSLSESGNAELADSLVFGLIEEHDLDEYRKKSYSSLRGAFTHDFDDFNNMKETVLKALEK